VLYLLLLVFVAILVYAGWRAYRASASRAKTRVIGPDDDPDFLWRLGRGDDTPRR
jgi:cbb3-type cytochrome oxidase subunit 3